MNHVKILIREAMQEGMRRPRHIQRRVLERDQSPIESELRLKLRKAMEINKVYDHLNAMVQLGEAQRHVRSVSRGVNGNLKGKVAEYTLVERDGEK